MSQHGTPAPIATTATPLVQGATPVVAAPAAAMTTSYVFPYTYVPYQGVNGEAAQPVYYYGAPIVKEGEAEPVYYYSPMQGMYPYNYGAPYDQFYGAPVATKSAKKACCAWGAPKAPVQAPAHAFAELPAPQLPAPQAFLVQTKEDGTIEYVPTELPKEYGGPEAVPVAEKKARKKCC